MAAATSSERWIDGLQFSSVLWPPPRDPQQHKDQVVAYVEYFGQFTSEQFPDDIAELVRHQYPSDEKRLLDDVLAMFVLHHPEHGHAVILPIISCLIDGSLVYSKEAHPFASFISLVCPSSENDYSEQWALACGEILRILTHYNRPIFKTEQQNGEIERNCLNKATTSGSPPSETKAVSPTHHERKPLRPLSPWICDILLAAPLGIRSDYFRWCSGVMGKYAAGELKPPTIASRGSGKHPQLMPSTPRWAVANGAGVILSVCDDEVARYETATLTAVAVPALLLPPPTTSLDEHLVAGLPALEPYARLFHRYYALATPSATQRLLLGLLEAPPSWAPDALDAAVQLVELLRAAEDYASGVRLPRNWMHLHFLRAIGIAMSMRAGVAADAAAALLFRILSRPALLFPPLSQVEGVEIQHAPIGGYSSNYRKQIEVPAAEATIEATAQGIASMLCAHGPEVEWRICTIWEAAYGLIPLNSSAVDLPEIIVASPLQPPILSWNLYIPLLKVLEYLPRGSPSEACLMKIFVATVETILSRTFHALFLEACAGVELASRLLFVVLTVCVSHEAQSSGSKRPRSEYASTTENMEANQPVSNSQTNRKSRNGKGQGPVAAFDSYVLAAVCALACEVQLYPLISGGGNFSSSTMAGTITKPVKLNGSSNEYGAGIDSAINHTRRILAILEALFSLKPSSVGTPWSYSSSEIVAAAMVAAHISELFRRSKALTHALSGLMRCKWDKEIHKRASSLYNLIDVHSKVVASIVDQAEPLEAYLKNSPVQKDSLTGLNWKQQNTCANTSCFDTAVTSASRTEMNPRGNHKFARHSDEGSGRPSQKGIEEFLLDASDLANFLTADRLAGFYCGTQKLLRSVLAEKPELSFSVVSLLWHKLIASPEIQPTAESTSAQQGWRQVVDALCNVVSATPAKAAAAVVLQAERELQPWIAKYDEEGQKMWKINQRIVKVLVELMRNHDRPESLVILASASDLLLRATDGMLVDGEACTLPQLELLEATARAIQPVLAWGPSGLAVVDGLSNLLKCRLPATIRCLSHPSAHVRALSTSVLRDIMNQSSIPIKVTPKLPTTEKNGMHSPSYRFFNAATIDWKADIQKCLNWEAHSLLSTTMPTQFLDTAARELGCTISLSQ
ncbi:PREDICTED: protein GIGANTEA-like [Camelina sativa]|uniref:Protein GIGANTEA-like n=1 Tax=Camelina sativa TaxID=90675 RepID=A0ABM0VY22_CAMSA|nr:PREDICTED: protein GIGANTEA-like [Camelina sativa]